MKESWMTILCGKKAKESCGKQRAVGKKGKINDQFSMIAEKEQFHVARVIELRYL